MPRVEREASEKGFIGDFYRMSPEEEGGFRDAIKQANGEIVVFMHPYYNLHNTTEPIPLKDLKHAKEVNNAVEEVLRTNGSPALIMEEVPNLSKLTNRLKFSAPQRITAVAGTGTDIAIPANIGIMEQTSFVSSKKAVQESWKRFLEKLKDLGIKEAEVGGSFLWADNRGGATGGMGSGCVGSLIKELAAAGIKVKIGETNPDSKIEIAAMPDSEFNKYL